MAEFQTPREEILVTHFIVSVGVADGEPDLTHDRSRSTDGRFRAA